MLESIVDFTGSFFFFLPDVFVTLSVFPYSYRVACAFVSQPFGFCTFEHGLSALRCRNVLSKLELSPFFAPDVVESLQVRRLYFLSFAAFDQLLSIFRDH